MPPFTDLLFGIPIQFVSALLLILLVFFSKNITLNKNILILYIGIGLSALYFAVRATIEGADVRIFQNLFVLVQFSHIVLIYKILKIRNVSKEGMFKFLLNLALFQAILGALMILIPDFKNIALQLYYLGKEENIFISQMRIFGISGDYTFFTPIYHGLLAIVATVFAIFKGFKYLLYLPLIIFIIILNGRFGLIVFIAGTLFILIYLILKSKIPKKLPIFITMISIIFVVLLWFVAVIAPSTFNWLKGGFEDTLLFITEGELEGNYLALAGSHLFFPDGIKLIFGEGFRVFSTEAYLRGFNHSDIGYVNDLFMGGIIYVGILYGSILWYLLRGIKKADLLTKSIIYSMIIALLLADFKGEVMRGGTALLGVLFIKLILSYNSVENNEKVEKLL